jgi:hypothetical protein
MNGFAPSAPAGASWERARTDAFGITRPLWSFTVMTSRPRRAGAWAEDGRAEPATVITASTTQARRRIYLVTWNFFASIFAFTLNASKTISSVGLPSIARWIRCGNWTPPTFL